MTTPTENPPTEDPQTEKVCGLTPEEQEQYLKELRAVLKAVLCDGYVPPLVGSGAVSFGMVEGLDKEVEGLDKEDEESMEKKTFLEKLITVFHRALDMFVGLDKKEEGSNKTETISTLSVTSELEKLITVFHRALDMFVGLDKKEEGSNKTETISTLSVTSEPPKEEPKSSELPEGEKKELTPEQQERLLSTLKERFESNKILHKRLEWSDVERALNANPEKMWSLYQLESTGGEPDVFWEDETGFIFGDCFNESPEVRRNLVFDKEAEERLRQEYPDEVCSGNVVDKVAKWGVELMSKEEHSYLKQHILHFDDKTHSWLKTPAHVRQNGQAFVSGCYPRNVIDCDFYKGFRCVLRVMKV
jgi:hypothetical protein